MSDLTADLRTVLDLAFGNGPSQLSRKVACRRVDAAVNAGARLVMPDAPLAEKLTEQERDDLREVVGDPRSIHDGQVGVGTLDRLRAALPEESPTEESETNR